MMDATALPQRPALRYFGGKFRLAPFVLAHLPPHLAYVEPFCGAASILLRKPIAPFECLNDIDGEVVNFFRILRDDTEAFVKAVELTPYAREEYDLANQAADDPRERARRFFIRSWQSHGGPSTAWNGGWRLRYPASEERGIPHEWNQVAHLWAAAARLKYATIENADWRKVARAFDGPDTLHYLDPPYLPSTRSAHRCGRYRFDMDEEGHRELASVARELRGMVVLSGYASPLYEELFGDWQQLRTRASTDGAEPATECLWLSPAAASALSRGQARLALEAS